MVTPAHPPTSPQNLACIAPVLLLMWMGPVLRNKMPGGVTITEFVRYRYGFVSEILTGLVTVFYMAIYLCSELTALSEFLQTFGINGLAPAIVVCAATATYTGGSELNFQHWQCF